MPAAPWPGSPAMISPRALVCRATFLRSWEISSEAIVPAATHSHLCRVVAVLAGESARFSGDGVSALSGDSPDYLVEAVPPPSTPNDSKGLHLGMDLAARVRHAGLSRARHEQEVPICEDLGMVHR